MKKYWYCTTLLVVALGAFSVFAVGQSSVITLQFPPGARATGTGEAFVAVADDANAIFYNPAGLGQTPLADSWKTFTLEKNSRFTAIATKRNPDFGGKDRIYIGTTTGIVRHSGRAWETNEAIVVERNERLRDIVQKYLKVEDEALLLAAERRLRIQNKIGMQHFATVRAFVLNALDDSLVNRMARADSLAWGLVEMAGDDRDSLAIVTYIRDMVDSSRVQKLAAEIEQAFSFKDVELTEMVEIRVPFTIAVAESVSAMVMDGVDRLWVGTAHGLWRYDGTVWNRFSALDGLPSDTITALAAHEGVVLVGTSQGAAQLDNGSFRTMRMPDSLGNVPVQAIALGRNGSALYLGTANGLWQRRADSTWSRFDTSSGLLSNTITALMYESERNRLWVGGHNGIALYDEKTWKRYKFPESVVYSMALAADGQVWIGTNKGAVKYTPGPMTLGPDGASTEGSPEWKTYHSKNALTGNIISAIAVSGSDIWLATENGINVFDYAQREFEVFHEFLLPAFNLKELWHMYAALVWPTEDWGTFGGAVNFINFGTNEYYDEFGVKIKEVRAWEAVFMLSYGLQIVESFSAGLNLKYVYSALAPGIGEGNQGIGQTWAIDAGLLKRNFLVPNFDLGLHLQTMGPPVYYISYERADPIPFIIKLGTAYHVVQTPEHDLKFMVDLNREVVKNYVDKRPDPFWVAVYTDLIDDTSQTLRQELAEVNLNMGMEYWYLNFIALRGGFMFDEAGVRYELMFGLGLHYGNINFDWSYIHSPEGFLKGTVSSEGATGARHGQNRFSFIFSF